MIESSQILAEIFIIIFKQFSKKLMKPLFMIAIIDCPTTKLLTLILLFAFKKELFQKFYFQDWIELP